RRPRRPDPAPAGQTGRVLTLSPKGTVQHLDRHPRGAGPTPGDRPMSAATLSTVHAQFESALPTIHEVARFAFRKRPHHEREEAIAEAEACCWKAWHGLVQRGKDPVAAGVTGIAAYAVRHVLNGRRLGNPTLGGHG